MFTWGQDGAVGTGRRQALAFLLLFATSLINYLDRYMISIVLPAIKIDLRLSDMQLGLISGAAFGFVYAAMGIPIGHLADRHPRRFVIAAALALWSAMTAACGLAQSVAQMALARVMVGVGEAGSGPASFALMSDLFPVRSRARAVSLFAMALPAGIFISFLSGGYIVQALGWRATMLTFGVPGMALAAVVLAFLPEPARGASDGFARPPGGPPKFRTVVGALVRRRSFVHVCLGSGLFTLVWLGMIVWLPSYFTRRFGLGIAEVGAELAPVLGLSQVIGLGLGGLLADRLAQRDARWYLWICVGASLLPMAFYALAFRTADAGAALLALFPALCFGLLQGAPALVVVQGVAGARMRATAVAIYFLVVNLIGGLGSFLIGVLSQQFVGSLGSASLGAAILSLALVASPWSALHFALGARFVRNDMAAAVAD